LSSLTVICAFIGAVCSTLGLILSRRAKIKIDSQLRLIDGHAIAEIDFVKDGQKRLVVDTCRLSLVVWDDSPRLAVSGLGEIRRCIEEISNPRFHYVSDDVVRYSSDNKKMDEGDRLRACIDLDHLMGAYIKSRENLGGKLFFYLMILTLKVEIVCTNGMVF